MTASRSDRVNRKRRVGGEGAGRASGGPTPGAGLRARPRASRRSALPRGAEGKGARPIPQAGGLFFFHPRLEGKEGARAPGTDLCSLNC